MEYTKVFIYCECLPGEVTELLIACLSGIGFESFEEKKTGLDAYIPSGFFDENELIKLLYNTVFQDFKLSYQIYRIPEKNWNKEWESNFSPTIIRDLCYIRAPFHPGRDNFRYELVILPRMSFGTGHHQTTRLMIESMLETDLNEKVVLDLGCGTGILAILASKMGAAKITALDIDEWAINNAMENVKNNRADNIKVVEGTITDQKVPVDVILVNINKNVLMEQLKYYSGIVNEKGMVISSGFYQEDIETITGEAANHDLVHADTRILDKWCAVTFIKA